MDAEKTRHQPLKPCALTAEQPNTSLPSPPVSDDTDASVQTQATTEASVFLRDDDNAANRPKSKGKKRKKKTTKQLLAALLVKIGVIALAVWLLFTFVLGFTIHYGNNMHPAIRDGDLIISFRLQKPFVNAAVLYRHDGKATVGRVIALEGSVVDVGQNGSFTVNGTAPSEEVFYPTYPADGSDIRYPYTVPEGSVFILNDFREDTNDSRSFGAVPLSALQGNLLLTMRRRGF